MTPDLGCAKHVGYVDGCCDCLRVWLDRRPALAHPGVWRWAWYDSDSGEYLGERSARTGPDHVGAEHHCGCEQCSGKVST